MNAHGIGHRVIAQPNLPGVCILARGGVLALKCCCALSFLVGKRCEFVRTPRQRRQLIAPDLPQGTSSRFDANYLHVHVASDVDLKRVQ